jgi:hypothetical protein
MIKPMVLSPLRKLVSIHILLLRVQINIIVMQYDNMPMIRYDD